MSRDVTYDELANAASPAAAAGVVVDASPDFFGSVFGQLTIGSLPSSQLFVDIASESVRFGGWKGQLTIGIRPSWKLILPSLGSCEARFFTSRDSDGKKTGA
jgi:hypothetical protein